jgi:hypothetical protein
MTELDPTKLEKERKLSAEQKRRVEFEAKVSQVKQVAFDHIQDGQPDGAGQVSGRGSQNTQEGLYIVSSFVADDDISQQTRRTKIKLIRPNNVTEEVRVVERPDGDLISMCYVKLPGPDLVESRIIYFDTPTIPIEGVKEAPSLSFYTDFAYEAQKHMTE